jgi:hypothetical protein
VPRNRETQTETAMAASHPGVYLTKALEDMRKKLGRNADSGILNGDFDLRLHSAQPHTYPALVIRELDGIRQEVPQDLSKPLGVAPHWRHVRIDDHLGVNAFGVGSGPNDFDGVLNQRGKVHGLEVQTEFARNDTGHVEHVLDDLGQRRHVARHDVHRAGLFVSHEQTGLHHADVPDNGIQGCPELM